MSLLSTKTFSFIIVIYMVLGITWWGMLLYQKNADYFDAQARWMHEAGVPEHQIRDQFKERRKQSLMILGEGLFLGLSLIGGIWIILRSAKKQVQAVNQQNNFLLSVSHELKSPLAGVKLALETVGKRKLPQESREKMTRRAVKDIDRLEQLIQNILLSTSIENRSLELLQEEFDVNGLLRDIVQKHLFNSKQIEIRYTGATSDSYPIVGDHRGIELAVSNILGNAVKYAPEGSCVTVALSADDKQTRITVSDQGPGMSAEEKDMIFKRFYRSERQEIRHSPGTGLGLYLSNEIIKAHGGTIFVEDNPEGGTTFTVEIPVK